LRAGGQRGVKRRGTRLDPRERVAIKGASFARSLTSSRRVAFSLQWVRCLLAMLKVKIGTERRVASCRCSSTPSFSDMPRPRCLARTEMTILIASVMSDANLSWSYFTRATRTFSDRSGHTDLRSNWRPGSVHLSLGAQFPSTHHGVTPAARCRDRSTDEAGKFQPLTTP
jgi:hypothetical protein